VASERRWRLGLTAVAAGAAAARIAVLAGTASYVPIHDDASYARVARALVLLGRFPMVHDAHGWIASSYRPPGWPLALAGLWSVTGIDVDSARLLLVGLGVATAIVGALLARRLAGPTAGIAAGALLALNPLLLATGATLESETLDTLLVLGTLLCAVRAREHRSLMAGLAAGALAGAAALTRTNDLLLVPVVAILAAPAPLRAHWRRALAIACAGLVVIAPWTIRNAIDLHHLVPVSTETGNTLAGTYNNASLRADARWLPPVKVRAYPRIYACWGNDGPVIDGRLTNAVLDWMKRHPGYVGEVLGWNTARLLGLDGPDWASMSLRTMSLGDDLGPAIWLGTLLVTALSAAELVRRRRQWAPIAFVAVLLLLPAALVNGEMRLAAPLQALLCIPAGAALASGLRREERRGDVALA
jgi:4-amino-4-deoxy-L-arabinose transferase-like glycosyltransferase